MNPQSTDLAAPLRALRNLTDDGEFATWLRAADPAMPWAAAREYQEAAALQTPDQAAVRRALHDLTYGGEFFTWMRSTKPDMPQAAALEYEEATALLVQLVGHPPRTRIR